MQLNQNRNCSNSFSTVKTTAIDAARSQVSWKQMIGIKKLSPYYYRTPRQIQPFKRLKDEQEERVTTGETNRKIKYVKLQLTVYTTQLLLIWRQHEVKLLDYLYWNKRRMYNILDARILMSYQEDRWMTSPKFPRNNETLYLYK